MSETKIMQPRRRRGSGDDSESPPARSPRVAPAAPPDPVEAGTILAEAGKIVAAGSDPSAVAVLDELLRSGALVPTIARTAGMSTAAVWALISRTDSLREAHRAGSELRQGILADAVFEAALGSVTNLRDIATNAEKDADRVSAEKVIATYAEGVGLFGGKKKDPASVGVAVNDELGNRLLEVVMKGG